MDHGLGSGFECKGPGQDFPWPQTDGENDYMIQRQPGPCFWPTPPGPQGLQGQDLAGEELPVCLQLVPLSLFLSISTCFVFSSEVQSGFLRTCPDTVYS